MMVGWLFYILIFITSLLATFLARKWLIKRSILDIPNERSSHLAPTPRGGGIAINLVWFGGLIFMRSQGIVSQNLFYALLSGAGLAIVGLLDDFIGVKPIIRLISQFVCISIAVYFLSNFGIFNFILFNIKQYWLIYPIFIIGGIWFVNLFNFLDGIDAYAATETIMVALGIYVITGSDILLLLIFCVAGFLIWNWPKARIFMGDIGSTQLGFVLFVLGLYFHNKGELDFFFWLILTSLFWMDASLTLARRIRNGEKLSKAHRNHGYQRIVQSGFSHQKVVIISVAINALFILLIYGAIQLKLHSFYLLLIIIIINYMLQRIIDRQKRYPSC